MRWQPTVFLYLGILLILLHHTGSVRADGGHPTPLIDDVQNAAFVVVGTFTNARSEGVKNKARTDFEIEATVKTHKIIEGLRKIVFEKCVDQPNVKFLIFCDVHKGKIEPYRAVRVDDAPEILRYVTGAGGFEFKKRSIPERLAYCLPFLNSKSAEVACDAHREFALSDYEDYRELARKLDPKVLVGWLDDPRTPPDRFGLYSRLLGDCRKGAQHGDYLRKLFLNRDRNRSNGLDGMLQGYVMIQPKEGWNFLEREVIGNPKNDFITCYSSLTTLRFLATQRPDLVDRKRLVAAMLALGDFSDMADFVIDDLRKWKRWETTNQVLALAARKSHEASIIQNAALRFALQSPRPQAADYVAVQRKRNPDRVSETEEDLAWESKLEPAGASK